MITWLDQSAFQLVNTSILGQRICLRRRPFLSGAAGDGCTSVPLGGVKGSTVPSSSILSSPASSGTSGSASGRQCNSHYGFLKYLCRQFKIRVFNESYYKFKNPWGLFITVRVQCWSMADVDGHEKTEAVVQITLSRTSCRNGFTRPENHRNIYNRGHWGCHTSQKSYEYCLMDRRLSPRSAGHAPSSDGTLKLGCTS